MSDFESMHDLVGAYALDAIDDAERVAFEAHLDECAQCREDLASFSLVLDALSEDAPDAPAAPAGLGDRIAQQIALTPQVSTGAARSVDNTSVDGTSVGGASADGTSIGDAPVSDGDTANLPRVTADLREDVPAANGSAAGSSADESIDGDSFDNVVPFGRTAEATTSGERTHADPAGRRSRLPMLLASAAAAVAVAAVGVGFLVNGGSPDANLAAVDAVLEAPDARTLELGVGDAEITVSDSAGGFAATGTAPDLATGEEYQLWMVNEDGTIEPGPTFEAGDFQTAVITDMSGVNAIAVSVEPAGGSEQPTTDPIAAAEL
jgi:anti-sigma-K factor RskA